MTFHVNDDDQKPLSIHCWEELKILRCTEDPTHYIFTIKMRENPSDEVGSKRGIEKRVEVEEETAKASRP